MQSRKYLFNWTIIKKNFLLSWPVWVFYSLTLFLLGPISYMAPSYNYYGIEGKAFNHIIEDLIIPAPYLALSVSIIVMLIQFSYLYKMRSTGFYHSIPVNRTKLFASNVLSGFLVVLIPNVVFYLIELTVGSGSEPGTAGLLSEWLLILCVEELFCIAIATLFIMLTGQGVASAMLYFVGIFFVSMVDFLLQQFLQRIWYGFYNWENNMFTILQPFKIMHNIDASYKWNGSEYNPKVDNAAGSIVIMLVETVVILTIAYLIYRRRKSEYAGDTIAVGFMRPVFACGTGVLFGLAMTDFVCSCFDVQDFSSEAYIVTVISMLLFSTFGYLATRMIMAKTFRVFGKYGIRSLIFSGAVLAGSLIIACDLFGYTTRIPDKEDIKRVSFYSFTLIPAFRENENNKAVDIVCDIHSEIIEGEKSTDSEYTKPFVFCYVLQDGTEINRHYFLDENSEVYYNISRIIDNNAEYILFPESEIITGSQISMLSYVNYDTNDYTYDTEYICSEKATRQIIDAIKNDISSKRIYWNTVYKGGSIWERNLEGFLKIDIAYSDYYERTVYINPYCTAAMEAIQNGIEEGSITHYVSNIGEYNEGNLKDYGIAYESR